MYLLNGKKLCAGQAFTIGEGDATISYPPNWLDFATAEGKDGLGIVEVPDPMRPDDRFNHVEENEDGSFTATPFPREVQAGIKWADIKAERDRRTEQGGYKVGTKWFHSDQKSRSQQLGLVLLGAGIPAGLQWKTMDGSFITMTQTLAQQVLGAAAASDQEFFAAAEAHKSALEACADPAAYDFSAGWPETFGG